MLFLGYNHVLLSSPLLLSCGQPVVVLQLWEAPAFANRYAAVMLLTCLLDVFPLSGGVLELFGAVVSHVCFEFPAPPCPKMWLIPLFLAKCQQWLLNLQTHLRGFPN